MKFKTLNTIICSAAMVSCCCVSDISCGNYPYRKRFAPVAVSAGCCSDICSHAVKRKQENPLVEMGSDAAFFLFMSRIFLADTLLCQSAKLDDRRLWKAVCRRQFCWFSVSCTFIRPLRCRHDIYIFQVI